MFSHPIKRCGRCSRVRSTRSHLYGRLTFEPGGAIENELPCSRPGVDVAPQTRTAADLTVCADGAGEGPVSSQWNSALHLVRPSQKVVLDALKERRDAAVLRRRWWRGPMDDVLHRVGAGVCGRWPRDLACWGSGAGGRSPTRSDRCWSPPSPTRRCACPCPTGWCSTRQAVWLRLDPFPDRPLPDVGDPRSGVGEIRSQRHG